MRTGDAVLHKPSGEIWSVAFVEDGRLCARGWPLSLVPVEDCELTRACSDDQHEAVLHEMAAMRGSDPRRSYARCVLGMSD